MIANVNVRQILLKRGNTVVSTEYTGPIGELTLDTDLDTVRVHDGITAGGVSVLVTQAQLDTLSNIVSNISTGGVANTGNVTFDNVKIIGAGTASGDGNGYATLELVPDANLYANDQYLVIDPTAPSHIHIRAGGAQDSSNAELYLGGEKNYVRVADFNGVRLYNESSFDSTEVYTNGVHFTLAAWTAGVEGQQSTVSFTSTDQNFTDSIFNGFFDDARNTLQIVTPEGTFTLTPTGFGSIGSGIWRFNVNEIPAPTPQTVSEIILTVWTTRQNSVNLNSDFTVEVTDDVRITGRDTFVLRNTAADEPIEIITRYGIDSYNWLFGADGYLTLPQVTSLTTQAGIFSNGDILFNTGESASWRFGNDGRLTTPGSINFNDESYIEDTEAFYVATAKSFEIQTAKTNIGDQRWTFGTDGSTTFPGAVIKSTAAVTGGTAPVGAATAITVTDSPNSNWTSGTGVSANGINFIIAVDGSGNATVTTINDGGTGHFVGETFGPLPGSALGGTDEVDDVYFEVTAVDAPPVTALDITKTVNKLTDGYYTLADGTEGQIMYLVRQNGSTAANIYLTLANGRVNASSYTDVLLNPFLSNSESDITTLIYTDNAWQSDNGTWD